MTPRPKLFAVCLGGAAPKANTELHDVVFAVGPTIQSTYEQLLDQWFGAPDGLHIDSWSELSIIDGHRVTLASGPSASHQRLFFVNMGAYAPGELGEVHANLFFVADRKIDVLRRARASSLQGMKLVHRDYLYDVDNCLEIAQVDRYYIHLEPTTEPTDYCPQSAYHLIPREIVEAFKLRMGVPPTS